MSAPTNRKTDGFGRPLLLRDSHLAQNTFGMGGSMFTATPKYKFMFGARFIRGGQAATNNQGQAATGASGLDWSRGVGFQIKYLDRPRIGFESQTLNQYNKKRFVQTRTEYDPLTLRFHDTIDNQVFSMFTEYYKFYYGEANFNSSTAWSYDITNSEFQNLGQWGFQPGTNAPNNTYFFDRIEIYEFYSRQHAYRFDLVHPKIISFDPDDLDYSNGAQSPEIVMQLNFEGIIFQGDISLADPANSGLIQFFGLDRSDYFEPDSAYPSDSDYLKTILNSTVSPSSSGVSAILQTGINAVTQNALTQLITNGKVNLQTAGASFIGTGTGVSTDQSVNTAVNNKIRDSIRSLTGGI